MSMASSRVEVLVATMYADGADLLLENMNLYSGVVIINQDPTSIHTGEFIIRDGVRMTTTNEIGLSRSRNMAISASIADYCVIADDDLTYEGDYIEKVKRAFNRYPEADIIAFRVDRHSGDPIVQKEGSIGIFRSMRVRSVQLVFRREPILKSGIAFDERFGAGTDMRMGEENIFLFDCIKAGLKLYAYPEKIAQLRESDSTWIRTRDRQYYYAKGRMFVRMSRLFSIFFTLQFILRKGSLLPGDDRVGMVAALMSGVRGVFDGWKD